MPRFPHKNSILALGIAVLALSFGAMAPAQRFVWPPTRTASPKAVSPKAVPQKQAASEVPNPAPQAAQQAEQASWDTVQPAATAESTPIAMPAMRVAPVAGGGSATIDWRILENPQGPHAALFFDPVRQVFAVYHVDSASGQIMLKSVRNVSADLRLEQFNSSNPAPKDIQSMLDEAR